MLKTLSDGISLRSSKYINIKNSSFRYMGHSALFIIESDYVNTDNLTIDVLSNSGIRFFGGTDFNITNNHIFCTTNGGNYAIQISNNYSGGKAMENVLIENNIIRHTAYAGIAIYTSTVEDKIENVTIKNNILYQTGSVVSNMQIFTEKEPNSYIQEGGGIDVQHAISLNINHNTIFNNQGSGIRIDNRFYIPDGTDADWENLIALDRLTNKTATITNNVIVGNAVSGYEEYKNSKAYGIEKRVAKYCGDSGDEVCPGTAITTANNIISDNDSGAVSPNIVLSDSDKRDFSGFINAQKFPYDIREISYHYDDEVNYDFGIKGENNPQIGAPAYMIQRAKDTYGEYRSYFMPVPDW